MNRCVCAAAVGLLLLAGCRFSSVRTAGEGCPASTDCDTGLECVIVDNNESVCLPQPPARTVRSCDSDTDCTRSDGELWPVEAECLDRECRCLTAEVFCDGDGDGPVLVLEEETCRCVPVGAEGDPCLTSHTCEEGFACIDSECRSAPEQLGSSCTPSRCAEGTCVVRAGADLGVCEE